MSQGRLPQLKLTLLRALLIAALPTACAVGVQPDMTDEGDGDSGSAPGGTGSMPLAGMSGSAAKAGSSSGGSVTNAFGGTSSSAGKAGGSSGSGGAGGGAAGGGGAGGSAKGGAGGSGGAGGGVGGSAGSSGSGGGAGGGTSTCACPKTLAWVDNTSINWSSGDCLSLGAKTYLYTGTRMQTYANSQCNPTKQETWCTDSGNDYKFMACN